MSSNDSKPHNKLRTLLLALVILGGLTTNAVAGSSRKVSHAYEKVWPAVVRFIRIDEGFEISEKDKESGYVLFSMRQENQEFSGAVEVIRRRDTQGRDAVELLLTLKKRPNYMADALADRLVLKLRKELGRPPEAPSKKPPSNTPPSKSAPNKNTPNKR